MAAIDADAIGRVAQDLRASGSAVLTAAQKVHGAADAVTPGSTGRDYGSVGERLQHAFAHLGGVFDAWGHSVTASADALAAAAGSYQRQDAANATDLTAGTGVVLA
jgi:hypothetical protein